MSFFGGKNKGNEEKTRGTKEKMTGEPGADGKKERHEKSRGWKKWLENFGKKRKVFRCENFRKMAAASKILKMWKRRRLKREESESWRSQNLQRNAGKPLLYAVEIPTGTGALA